jgi:hypothetical protein
VQGARHDIDYRSGGLVRIQTNAGAGDGILAETARKSADATEFKGIDASRCGGIRRGEGEEKK